MNLTISGHHLELTAPIRAYAQEKMKRLERHFDHLLSAQVILSVDQPFSLSAPRPMLKAFPRRRPRPSPRTVLPSAPRLAAGMV